MMVWKKRKWHELEWWEKNKIKERGSVRRDRKWRMDDRNAETKY